MVSNLQIRKEGKIRTNPERNFNSKPKFAYLQEQGWVTELHSDTHMLHTSQNPSHRQTHITNHILNKPHKFHIKKGSCTPRHDIINAQIHI